MLTQILSLLKSDEGLEMVEYAMIIAVIALIALSGYIAIGQAIDPKAEEVKTELERVR